jgi:hypothetical protein
MAWRLPVIGDDLARGLGMRSKTGAATERTRRSPDDKLDVARLEETFGWRRGEKWSVRLG